MALAEQIISYESVENTVFTPTRTLKFILTEEKTLVVVNPDSPVKQVFIIKYDHRNYEKQLEHLRNLIKKGKMRSVVDLVTYCKLRPGRQYQMYGLELIPTKLERHI